MNWESLIFLDILRGAIMRMSVELNERLTRKEKTPEVIMFRHEQGAGHAAEGYAKITGNLDLSV